MLYHLLGGASFKHFAVETLGASSQAHATKLSWLANPGEPCWCPPPTPALHPLGFGCMHVYIEPELTHEMDDCCFLGGVGIK